MRIFYISQRKNQLLIVSVFLLLNIFSEDYNLFINIKKEKRNNLL